MFPINFSTDFSAVTVCGVLDRGAVGIAGEGLLRAGYVAVDGSFAVFSDAHGLSDGLAFWVQESADILRLNEGWSQNLTHETHYRSASRTKGAIRDLGDDLSGLYC